MKDMIVFLVLSWSLQSVAQGAPDNRGTEFVIGFPPSRSAEQNAYINVTTSKPHDITVYVTAPRFPEANLNETFVVRQGLVISVTVSHILRGSGDSRKRLESKAIQITATDEIIVYATDEIDRYPNYLAYPTDGAGKEFYLVNCYQGCTCNHVIAGDCLETWLVGSVSAYYVTGWGAPVKCCNRSVPVWQHYNLSHAGLENSTNITIEYLKSHSDGFKVLFETLDVDIVVLNRFDTYQLSQYQSIYTLPPMEQFAAGYDFLVNTASPFDKVLALFAKRVHFSGLRLDGKSLPIGTSYTELYFLGESYLASSTQINDGLHSIRHVFPNVVFGSVVIGSSPDDIYIMPSGTRLSPVNTECTNTSQIVADGLDNDCDRAVDEELCNGEDEDNDGLIDEDCVANLCENGGTCTDEQCSACICSTEYRGQYCGFVACTSNTCKNGGTCSELKSNIACMCRPGYHGTHCETGTTRRETVVRRTSFLSSSEARLHFITDEEIPDFFDIGVEIYCGADVYEIGDGSSLEQSSPEIFRPLQIDLNPISIDNGEEASIPVTINIPFGCSSTSEDCSLQFELSNTTDLFARNRLTVGFKDTWTCDVEVNRGRRSQLVDDLPIVRKIVLTPVNDMQFENERAVNLKVKTKVHGKAKSYWTKEFQAVLPVQIRDFSSRRRSYCYSHVDPHMRTFDGTYYENQNLDEFIMYYNSEWQILIQTKTKRCNGNRATCSCSCTMKSGGDIFMVSHCDAHRTQFLADKNKSLYVERIHANTYKVIFPNLMRVVVNVLPGYGYTMNIDIYPAPGDRNKVHGLCGNFNGDPNDDFVPRGAIDVTSEYNFAMSWSLVHTDRQSESLQSSQVIQSTTRWNEGGLYCICPNGQAGGNGVTICNENKRDLLIGDIPDKYLPIIAKPWINPDEVRRSNGVDKRDASTLDALSYDEARSMCENAFFDCPVYAERDALQEIKTDSYIHECAQDVAMTGDIEWAVPHCEALGSYFVIQLEIDEEFALSLDQGLVNDILCQMCPGNCGGHGTCTNCYCVCDEGYGTDACLVDLNKPPTLNEISPDGVCDIARGEDCSDIVVSGDGFVDTPECRMQIQQADTTGYFGDTATSATDCSYLEFNEIAVDIAATRRRRSVADPVTVVAERYGFSISNNGLNFSDFQYVVVIDSTCQNSTTDENGTLLVVLQPDFCYIARACYRAGERTTDGCNRCVPTVSSFTWTTACEDADEGANILLRYIAGIAGAVLLAILIALVVTAVRKLRKTRRNSRIRSTPARSIYTPPRRTNHSVMFVNQKVHPDIDVTYDRGMDGRP